MFLFITQSYCNSTFEFFGTLKKSNENMILSLFFKTIFKFSLSREKINLSRKSSAYISKLEFVSSIVNINQGRSRSKKGRSFRFRCPNYISTQSVLKRAVLGSGGEKRIFCSLKLRTRQHMGAFKR